MGMDWNVGGAAGSMILALATCGGQGDPRRLRLVSGARKLMLLLAMAVVSASCDPGSSRQSENTGSGLVPGEAPERIIILIADGMGVASYTAAKWRKGALAVQRMEVAGLTDVRSSDSWITDSAAGATAYATGQRTYNGAIGVGPRCLELLAAEPAAVAADPASCDPLEGVFDVAQRAGMATGLVATSSITHATPASFGAKVPRRAMQAEIAEQLAAGSIDVLLGGGWGWFDGDLRADGRDLLTPLCGEADCPRDAAALAARTPSERRLVGLFAEDGMPPASEGRTPGLAEMTRAALNQLVLRRAGFVLMVEGSQPDWRAHDNAPLSDVVAEALDFDGAVEAALDFQAEHPETLVLVVSDHETGGLSLLVEEDEVVPAYNTGGHSGEMTPHFAHGPGSDAFSGILENYEIGALLLNMVTARAGHLSGG